MSQGTAPASAIGRGGTEVQGVKVNVERYALVDWLS